jgi:hypothetical protein
MFSPFEYSHQLSLVCVHIKMHDKTLAANVIAQAPAVTAQLVFVSIIKFSLIGTKFHECAGMVNTNAVIAFLPPPRPSNSQ